ncbi:TPA: phage tail protein, partial [Streptococcus pneumoniae]
MIKHNELVIDGVRTSSFPFKVIVHDSPSIALGESKTALLEHGGVSGAIVQTNKHRELVKKSYTIYLVKPTEEQMNQFMSLFIREKFWLESERVKTTRLWCYKVNVTDLEEVQPGLYMTKATFTCHPTKYFKATDTQRLTRSGTLNVQGSALAFPKIT